MKSDLETIETGKRIRLRRQELGLTLRNVAESLNITHSAVSQWEIGKTNISADNFLKLSLVLRSNPYELLSIDKHSISEPLFDVEKLSTSLEILETFTSRKKIILDTKTKAKILTYIYPNSHLTMSDDELSRLIELAK